MRVLVLSTVLFLLGAGGALAQAPSGSVPADPRTADDLAACLDALNGTVGSACVGMYAHFSGPLMGWVNVQRPPDGTAGSLPMAGPFVQPATGYNSIRFAMAPGFADYGAPGSIEYGSDTRPRVMPDPRVAREAFLSPAAPATAHWFVSLQADNLWAVQGDLLPAGAALCLTLRTTVEEHDSLAPVSPRVIAAGTTTRSVVSAPLDGPMEPGGLPCPNGALEPVVAEALTEIETTLVASAENARLTEGARLLVRLEWYTFAPNGPDGAEKVVPSGLRFHLGPDTPNRVVLPLAGALAVERIEVVPFEGDAYIRVHAMSPWGAYDVDRDAAQIELLDADGTVVAEVDMDRAIFPRADYHNHGTINALNFSVPWSARESGVAPGLYELRVVAYNWQHTAKAEASVPVVVGRAGDVFLPGQADPGAAKATPGPAAALALAAVLWMLLAARRRPTVVA